MSSALQVAADPQTKTPHGQPQQAQSRGATAHMHFAYAADPSPAAYGGSAAATPATSSSFSTPLAVRSHGAAASPSTPAGTPTLHAGTSAFLRERIRAQEANLRRLRAHSPATSLTSPAPPPPPPTLPASPAPTITSSGVVIPPLRFPVQTPPPPAAAAQVASPTHDTSVSRGSSRSSGLVQPLPQSNESATYFESGGDLALIMRVRLDTGVHSLEVPYGIHSQSLAAEFGERHSLAPAQVRLLGTAISSHLDLLDQYQAQAVADEYTDDDEDATPRTERRESTSPASTSRSTQNGGGSGTQRRSRRRAFEEEEDQLEEEEAELPPASDDDMDDAALHDALEDTMTAPTAVASPRTPQQQQQQQQAASRSPPRNAMLAQSTLPPSSPTNSAPLLPVPVRVVAAARPAASNLRVRVASDEFSGIEPLSSSSENEALSPNNASAATAAGYDTDTRNRANAVTARANAKTKAAAAAAAATTSPKGKSDAAVRRERAAASAAAAAAMVAAYAASSPTAASSSPMPMPQPQPQPQPQPKSHKRSASAASYRHATTPSTSSTASASPAPSRIPVYTPPPRPRTPSARGSTARTPTALELARHTSIESQSPHQAASARRREASRGGPASSPTPFKAAPGRAAAWTPLLNATPSERNLLKGLKGALDTEAAERELEQRRTDERRRMLAALKTAREKSTAGGAAADADASDANGATPELQFGASFRVHQAEQRRAARRDAATELELERAREYAAFLAANPSTPFISPKSRELAAKRAAEKAELAANPELAAAKAAAKKARLLSASDDDADDIHARLHGDSRILRRKREALRRRRAEEAAAEKKLALFRVTGRSKQLLEDSGRARSASAPRSAALRLYEEDQARARERAMKQAAKQAAYKTAREADDEANCTFRPALNALAQSVAHSKPIWARDPTHHRLSKQATIERELKRRAAEDEKQLTFTPVINHVSNEITMAKRAEAAHAHAMAQANSLAHATQIQLMAGTGTMSLVSGGDLSRSASASRSGSASPSRRLGGGSARSVSPSLRSVASNASSVGMAASQRLHEEASLRRLKAAQLQALNDDRTQPFSPATNTFDLLNSPMARVDATRKQLRALEFMAQHQTRGSQEEDGEEAAVDWQAEKRRVEHQHKEQLKQIHQQFLHRNEEFLQRKKEYMDRISTRFQQGGTYEYDPSSHEYRFQPFFQPKLVSKQLPEEHTNEPSYARHMRQTQHALASTTTTTATPASEMIEQDVQSEAGEAIANGHISFGGPSSARLPSSSRPASLVSSGSSSLLASREQQRIELLFALLDEAGDGLLRPTSVRLIDDIPSAVDRSLVHDVFEKMDRANNAHFAAAGGGVEEKDDAMSAAVEWSLDHETFARLFGEAYQTLVQRQGPQASRNITADRERKHTRPTTTTATATAARRRSPHHTAVRAAAANDGLGPSAANRACSADRHSGRPTAEAHAGRPASLAALALSNDSSRSPSPASRATNASSAVPRRAAWNPHGTFAPRLGSHSEELAARNRAQTIEAMRREAGLLPGTNSQIDTNPSTGASSAAGHHHRIDSTTDEDGDGGDYASSDDGSYGAPLPHASVLLASGAVHEDNLSLAALALQVEHEVAAAEQRLAQQQREARTEW